MKARAFEGLPSPGFLAGVLLAALALGLFWHAQRLPPPAPPPAMPAPQKIALVQPVTPPPPLAVPTPTRLPAPMPQQEAEPRRDEAPDAEDTPAGGIDGPAGNDAFGLRRGQGPVVIGGEGQRRAYLLAVQRALRERLMREKSLRRIPYRLVLRVTVEADGTVRVGEMIRGSGNPDLDREILGAMAAGIALQRSPPDARPLRLTLEISSRS